MKYFITLAAFFLFLSTDMQQVAAQSLSPQADADAIAMAAQRIQSNSDRTGIDSPGQIVVAYFTPRDRKPAANHTERIRRIVEEAANFYHRELNRHGFQERQMEVLRNSDGKVDVIDVIGMDKDEDYDKPDGQKIRNETIAD